MERVRTPIILFCLFVAGGCSPHHEALPSYQWSNDAAALRTLSQRARAAKTVSAACLLTLTRPDGNSVRLDGAVVLSQDDRSVRIRTWKFNQPVFDLTLTPQGLWVEIPRQSRGRGEVVPASVSAGQLARALSVFGRDFFDDPNTRVIDGGGKTFEVSRPMDAGQTMTAVVDRATLTVQQYRLADPSGGVHFTLSLQDYQEFNGTFWPTRLIARSDTGTIDAELRDVEINGELPPAAFIPPRGAEKLP